MFSRIIAALYLSIGRSIKDRLSNKSSRLNSSDVKYLRKGSYSLVGSSLLDSIVLFIPVILFSLEYSSKELGIFSMAQLFLIAPISLIGGVVGAMILAEMPKMEFNSKHQKLAEGIYSKRFVRFVVLAMLFYVSLVWVIPESLLNSIFGPEWNGIASLLKTLSVPNSFLIAWYPIYNLLISIGDFQRIFRYSILRFILVISAGAYSFNANLHWDLGALVIIGSGALGYAICFLSELTRSKSKTSFFS
jgi:O-antigen/teichoic acid export membrane protein